MKDQTDSQERRRFHRVLFDAPVEIESVGVSMRGTLLDISLKGALIKLSGVWPQEPDKSVQLHIPLDEDTNVIHMDGLVVHQEMDHIGVLCHHIDMDSITHLRRLVELNLGQPELLERELMALG